MVKNMPAMQETQVWTLGWECSLEKGVAAHSSILCPENSMDRGTSQRVGHDWAVTLSLHFFQETGNSEVQCSGLRWKYAWMLGEERGGQNNWAQWAKQRWGESSMWQLNSRLHRIWQTTTLTSNFILNSAGHHWWNREQYYFCFTQARESRL